MFRFIFILMMGLLISFAPVSAQNVKVTVKKYTVEVSANDASEIANAAWIQVFPLKNSSCVVSDFCQCGTLNGKYYIASPDGTQMFTVSATRLQVVNNDDYALNKGEWAEFSEPLKGHEVKYVYGYWKDTVYVIILGAA